MMKTILTVFLIHGVESAVWLRYSQCLKM